MRRCRSRAGPCCTSASPCGWNGRRVRGSPSWRRSWPSISSRRSGSATSSAAVDDEACALAERAGRCWPARVAAPTNAATSPPLPTCFGAPLPCFNPTTRDGSGSSSTSATCWDGSALSTTPARRTPRAAARAGATGHQSHPRPRGARARIPARALRCRRQRRSVGAGGDSLPGRPGGARRSRSGREGPATPRALPAEPPGMRSSGRAVPPCARRGRAGRRPDRAQAGATWVSRSRSSSVRRRSMKRSSVSA